MLMILIADTVLYNNMLLFADDTKCFRQIKSHTDQQLPYIAGKFGESSVIRQIKTIQISTYN